MRKTLIKNFLQWHETFYVCLSIFVFISFRTDKSFVAFFKRWQSLNTHVSRFNFYVCARGFPSSKKRSQMNFFSFTTQKLSQGMYAGMSKRTVFFVQKERYMTHFVLEDIKMQSFHSGLYTFKLRIFILHIKHAQCNRYTKDTHANNFISTYVSVSIDYTLLLYVYVCSYTLIFHTRYFITLLNLLNV